jgi:hypothetical protein
MAFIDYDDPRKLFRIYADWECDQEGYPFIWPTISQWVRRYANDECEDCGHAYRVNGGNLTVHHFTPRKADCRRENLMPLCWPCHSLSHTDTHRYKNCRCPYCKAYFIGGGHLRRHIRGKHADLLEKKRA